jgi:hypothetical protein
MKTIASLIFLLTLLPTSALTHAQVPAGFSRLDVPPSITVKQELAAPPPKWQAGRTDAKPMVKAVTVFDGDPREQASLVPDNEVKSKTAPYTLWTFDPKGKRAIWLQVQYTGTSLHLAQALPPGTRELRVYYEPGQSIDGYGVIRQVVYR